MVDPYQIEAFWSQVRAYLIDRSILIRQATQPIFDITKIAHAPVFDILLEKATRILAVQHQAGKGLGMKPKEQQFFNRRRRPVIDALDSQPCAGMFRAIINRQKQHAVLCDAPRDMINGFPHTSRMMRDSLTTDNIRRHDLQRQVAVEQRVRMDFPSAGIPRESRSQLFGACHGTGVNIERDDLLRVETRSHETG